MARAPADSPSVELDGTENARKGAKRKHGEWQVLQD